MAEENNSNPFKTEESEDIETPENVEIKEDIAEEKSETEDNDLQKKYDELNQQYLRLAADFDNYRKRQEQEKESLIGYGTEIALTKLIEVLDNFDGARKSLENVDDPEKIKESFDLINKQVVETLSKMGLEEIKAIGEEFDPNFHEAVMQTPTEEYPEHTVMQELRKGYKMGDKVLRATMVNVASGK